MLIGKTNMDEFAMGGSNENSAFSPRTIRGTCADPRRVQRRRGGVRGRRHGPALVGTDTGGSVRCPAALCGVSGLKPTYGRVSRFGLIAFASSLNQVGPLGRTVEDWPAHGGHRRTRRG